MQLELDLKLDLGFWEVKWCSAGPPGLRWRTPHLWVVRQIAPSAPKGLSIWFLITRLLLGSQPRTEAPEYASSRQRDADRQEGQQTVSPPVAQRLVHTVREQRERKRQEALQELCSGRGRTDVFGVGVHDVGGKSGAKDLHAEGQQGSADVDDEPVKVVLRGPAVDQEPYRCDEGTRQHQRDAQLGHVSLAGARRQPPVGVVHQRAAKLRACYLAGADGYVVQAGDGDGIAVRRHVQGREARERKVQQAVVDARQDGLHLDDGVERE